ncbi:MAG: hypothetical protein H6Q19_1381, partial [Bacteroidetes bacterium]|nr:hypothetical protein [Bacteroidota bacterium]
AAIQVVQKAEEAAVVPGVQKAAAATTTIAVAQAEGNQRQHNYHGSAY